MAEYIDREKLIVNLIESACHHVNNSREESLLYRDRNIVREQPTVQAIPLDKVKQAREEINDLDIHFDNDYFSSNRDAMFKCNEVLAILDKLIESEDKKNE